MCHCLSARRLPPAEAQRHAALPQPLHPPQAAPGALPHAGWWAGAVRESAWFEYVGATGLTVFGAASGRRYRFDQPGERLSVDGRDRAGLERLPQLRLVS